MRPQLECNNAIWGPHYITDKQNLKAIQKWATRMISTCSELSYTDRLQHLNLYHRFSIEDVDVICCFCIKWFKLYKLFSPSTISMTRGHNMKLQKPHTNCLPRSSFFSVWVINDWNSLPQSVINASSTNQFKNLLDRHYLDVMYSYCKPLCIWFGCS